MTLLLTLLACTSSGSDTTDTGAEVIDVRVDEADIQLPEGGWYWEGPDVVVDPGMDVMWCRSGTYEGDDVGVVTFATYQGEYGHHLQLYGTTLSPVDLPDGEDFDCTSSNDLSMADLEPIGIQTETNNGSVGVELPPGFAYKLDAGQRYVLQSHYVNTSTQPVHIRDLAVFAGVPEDQVETWANMLVVNHQLFDLPPHEETSSSKSCSFDQDYNVLALLGHLHEWGRSFQTELTIGDQSSVVYDVPTWETTYRDAPPLNTYEEGAFTLHAGEVLTNHCTWFNDTDEAITFPHEMCTTVMLAYPMVASNVCSD